MFVKLFKSVVFSYVLRKGLKEADLFVSYSGGRDSSFCLCPECGQNSPATLSKINTIRSLCPACVAKLNKSDSKTNSNHIQTSLAQLEQLDYIF